MSNTSLAAAALLLLGLPAATLLVGGLYLDSWVAGGLAAFFVFLLGTALAQVSGLADTSEEE